MPSHNSCDIIGHAGKDAELTYTKSNKPVCNISVAVKSGWGEYERTSWTKVRVIGKPAEWAGATRKGDVVVALGAEYVVDEWDKDGETKRIHYFVCGMGSTFSAFTKDGMRRMGESGDTHAAQPASEDNVPF